MELRLTLLRRGFDPTDIAVDVDPAATVGAVADTIRRCEPDRSLPIGTTEMTVQVVEGDSVKVLPRELPVLESTVRSGAHIALVPASGATELPRPIIGALDVVGGPDEGREFALRMGAAQLGRSADCDIVLNDPLVSAIHARIQVADTVEIYDLNSSNGIEISGQVVSRAVLQDEDVVVIGGTAMRVRLDAAADLIALDRAAIDFPRGPRLDPVYEGVEESSPAIPETFVLPRPPIVPMIVPLLMGGVLFAVTRSALSVIFVAMMPILMLGTFIESSLAGKKAYRRRVATYHGDLALLEQRLLNGLAVEQRMRLAEQPSTDACVAAVDTLGSLMWSRRAEHASFMRIRLGVGLQTSRNSVKHVGGDRGDYSLRADLEEVVDRYRLVPDVPIVGDLRTSGNIGIAVGAGRGLPTAFGLVCQLTSLHAPTDLHIVALTSLHSARSWDWLKWLPHVAAASDALPTSPLASTSPECSSLVAALAEIVALRSRTSSSGARSSEIPQRPSDPARLPEIVVLVADDAPVSRALLVQLAESGPDQGVHLLWVAPTVHRIPAACRTYVDVSAADGVATAGYVHTGQEILPLAVEGMELPEAESFARSLAPVVDAAAMADEEASLPRTVSFVAVAGHDLADSPAAVVERWRESGSLVDADAPVQAGRRREGSLRAWVGSAAGESLYLDLRLHGPHALVGGTTGAGKSEFLQTWIIGMATAHSPSRVSFLFVDYKGGSAFAECVKLPHTVGLVTDLSPHLVTRALASLNAELRHREHILNRKRAKDLVELERRGDPDAPPSLIIIVDEFAALVQEVPAFVDGVVNVAQRGRSLGLHLVLATQRPAGVIKDNLRANTNLRIALRMADEADSTDVIGDASAAAFSPDLPGRGVAKTGPGRLVPFQAGYVGGWTRRARVAPKVGVRSLLFGTSEAWAEPPADVTEASHEHGPTDLERVVATVSAASALAAVPEPRKPWLPELAHCIDLAGLVSADSDEALAFGIGDNPDEQSQPVVAFHPDRDGAMAVFGTGGSGKSAFLRSIAVAAASTPGGGPCEVYAIDAGGRGLAMLEQLPHVGSVINGDDDERIDRLISRLRDLIDDRAVRYAKVNAGSISEYRAIADRPDEARVLLLVDNFGAFRQTYEMASMKVYDRFLSIASDGRQVGVHVLVSADRPGAIPTALAAAVQRRLVLRLANENDESMLNVPRGMFDSDTPPGRGLYNGIEVQVAVVGGSGNVAQQSEALVRLAEAMTSAGRSPALPVERLHEIIRLADLPADVDGLPTLGVDGSTLQPTSFVPQGVFLLAGPPQSGRTTVARALVGSLKRWHPAMELFYVGHARSPLAALGLWRQRAVNPADAAALATALAAEIEARDTHAGRDRPWMTLVVESVSEWAATAAEDPLAAVMKAARQHGQFVIVESETTAAVSNYGFMQVVKADRTGLVLQPDQADGESLFKTAFPRVFRRDFPPGRGLVARAGRNQRVQVALPDGV